MKVDKDASDCSVNESKDVLVRNEEKEEKQEKEEEEMETWATNRSYKKKRVCRRCGYSVEESNYIEQMDDNGMDNISVNILTLNYENN